VKKLKEYKKILLLFLTFLKIGAFTFGGGYAMISVIRREVCEKRKWIDDGEILDMLAISESTPGPIAINSATFVGYRVGGVLGSAAATLGVILPSLVIITVIAFFLEKFSDYKIVKYAFFGIRAGVCALIVKAFVTMSKQCPKNVISYAFAAISFVAVTVFDISAVYIIIGGGILGLCISLLLKKEGKSK